MLDVSSHPMALYGALAALFVFGIFIGTWWFYAIRLEHVKTLLRNGEAILLHVDPLGALPEEHVAKGSHIPLEELSARAAELPRGRKVVVCTHGMLRTMRATRILRGLGFSTMAIDHA
jgi:rhodanese-related sulfurtransferase